MALTPKKKLYAESRMAGLNIKDSAIAAGYSEDTARQSGSRLEKDVDVRRYIGRIDAAEPKQKPEPKQKQKQRPEPKPKAEQKPKPKAEYVKPSGRPAPEVAPIPLSESAQKQYTNPLKFFETVMNDPSEDPKLRMEAAKNLAAFTVAKPGDKGKKEQKLEDAGKIASKFSNVRQLRPNA